LVSNIEANKLLLLERSHPPRVFVGKQRPASGSGFDEAFEISSPQAPKPREGDALCVLGFYHRLPDHAPRIGAALADR
jgi:hypothetical protein